MFFKKIKNTIFLLFLTTLIIPTYALAYSDRIIAGGENIGIELNSSGIIIVGTYEVNGINPAKESGLQNGDKIIKSNNNNVSNIEEMLNVIEGSLDKNNLSLTYLRGNKENNTTLKLNKDRKSVV